MLSAFRTRSARGRTVTGLLTALTCAGLLSCDDSSGADEPEPTEDYVLGCGVVDEDLVVEILGGDVTSEGSGEQPRDQISECDVTSVGSPDTFMLIRASYPPAKDVENDRSTWPEQASDLDCDQAWVAPGQDTFGAACVEDAGDRQNTLISALWGDLKVNVTISRPEALPSDAEDGYRITESVAEHLPQ